MNTTGDRHLRPIENALARFPRVQLTRLPTPLDHLKHLSDLLGTKVLLKREDLTDLALGGDKPRKLEFELAGALDRGADTLVTTGSAQSNHARLTTAAARRLGMDAVVVLSNDRWASMQGNLLTVHLMGAKVVLVDTDDHWDLEARALEECAWIEASGGRPHYIPVSGTTDLGSLAGVEVGIEIANAVAAGGDHLSAAYITFGTGGGFTGLLLGLREMGFDCPVVGISVNRPLAECRANVDTYWPRICKLLGLHPERKRGTYEIYDEFIGEAYGEPTEESLDAISTLARTEGVLLDPVYSAKMFAGFLAHCAEGRWENDTVAIVHTGGVPALFAYHDVIEAHLRGIDG